MIENYNYKKALWTAGSWRSSRREDRRAQRNPQTTTVVEEKDVAKLDIGHFSTVVDRDQCVILNAVQPRLAETNCEVISDEFTNYVLV